MVILGVNVAVFLLQVALGGSGDLRVLVRMGAMVPGLVAEGEYWRLVTAMFLHVGIRHIAFNSLALLIFGSLVEESLGRGRLVAVYLVTGFCANAVSFAFGDPVRVAAGASGAVFGLLGAWLVYNLRRRSLGLARANVQVGLLLVGLNLAFGFAFPGIDNLAHLGGLGAGLLAGLVAEGVWGRAMRTPSTVVGFAIILMIGVALAAWRTAALAG